MVLGGSPAYNEVSVRESGMSRRWITVCFALAAAAAGPAMADIYTWVDKDGVTHVSNVQPPEDVRVTKVARAAPKDPAREAAAREAARLSEVRALRERVDELSKEVEHSRDATPPPYAAAPVMAFAPPAPAPTVVVTVINQPAQQPEFAPSGCDYTLGSCGVGFFPAYPYYAPPFQRGFHKPHHRKWATPTRQSFGIPPPLIPYPATTRSGGGRRVG
jgi:hypothetical protein